MLALVNMNQVAPGGKSPSAQELRPNANKRSGRCTTGKRCSPTPPKPRRRPLRPRLSQSASSWRTVGTAREPSSKATDARCEGWYWAWEAPAVLLRRLLRFHFERTPALLFRFWRLFRRPPRKTWPHAAIKRFRLSGSKAQDKLDPASKRSEILLHGDRVLRRILSKRLRGKNRQGAKTASDQPEGS